MSELRLPHCARLVLDDEGTGRPVVFIHGFGASRAFFEKQRPLAGEGLRLIRIDVPGMGDSAAPAPDASIESIGAVIQEALERVAIDRAHLVGHSAGGGLVQWLALEAPDRVLSVTLVDTSPAVGRRLQRRPDGTWDLSWSVPRRLWWALLPWTLLAAPRPIRRLLPIRTPGAFGPRLDRSEKAHWWRLVLDTPTPSLRRTARLVTTFDVTERVEGIRVPALLVHGALDRVVPPSHAEYLHERIAGSRLHLFPDVAHHPMLEAPEAFNELLLGFLRDLVRPGGRG